MTTYRLSPEFFRQMRRRMLLILVPILTAALIVAVLVQSRGQLSSTSLLVIPILIGILVFVVRNVMKEQQRLWSSYTLVMREGAISRMQEGFPNVEISQDEITEITEYLGQGLLIKGMSKNHQIFVPATLENFTVLKNQFDRWQPINVVRSNNDRPTLFLLIFAGLASVAAYTITALPISKYVVASVGIVYFIVLCVGMFIIQRSSLFDRKVKRASWWIILPMLTIGARVFIAVTSR